ncbi:hypothetical protein J2W23_003641 [Variovorax boronicumulans]|uniref:hypothetical protein n=1 Tax=Variovorax boronicumulans TaxID=436515 RepID=UPI00159E57AF|nr:hypothetical protein [Variovorax boronicumulans]MDQ0015242.1 hypothetical protein [Variovorax boronicumulans]
MKMPTHTFVLAAAFLLLPTAAVHAQSADNPPKAERAHTLKPPPRNSKVVSGVQRGTNAAGRGIDRAEDATRRGVNNVSARASRPVRNVGEAFGRKLAPGSSGRAAPPPVGPQGSAP